MALTKVQRNDIFRAIVAGGLEPSECEFWYQVDTASLRHDLSKSTFSIGGDSHDHYMGFVKVGDNKQTSFTAGDWDGVLPHIEQWASEAKRYAEIDAEIPDLWAELRSEKEFLADVQYNAGNTLFSSDEQAEVARRLREIKEHAQQTYSLTNEQIEYLAVRFDEVEEASRRIGRKDWLLLFYGTLFNLIITTYLPPDVAKHILMSFIQGLMHLFGIGGPPPSIPPVA